MAVLVAGTAGCVAPKLKREPFPPADVAPFRGPAVPLFVQSPVLHVWLCGDRLADDSPKHWNGQIKGMAGLLRVDGRPYRFLGLPGSPIPAMLQTSVRVLPTRAEFRFSVDDVHLCLEFLTPCDPTDLKLLALPVGMIRIEVSAAKPRAVQVHLDITGEWAAGSSDRRITWDESFRIRPSQPRLFHETHNYPDWGDVHWTAVEPATPQVGVDRDVRGGFAAGTPVKRDARRPRAVSDEWPVFAHQWDLGRVEKPVVRRAVLAHARREVATFFGAACPAAWTVHWDDPAAMIAWVARSFEEIRNRLGEVDGEVVARSRAAGGDAAVALAGLAFRQAFAATEWALLRGEPAGFVKSMDISGPGAMQSTDILLASAPAAAAFNRDLLRAQVRPAVEALRRPDWGERGVPRDLGVHPNATGPVHGSSATATADLILLAALAGPEAWEEFRGTLTGPAAALAEETATSTALRPILALACFPEHRAEAEARFKRRPRDADPDLVWERILRLGLSKDAPLPRPKPLRYGSPADPARGVVSIESMAAWAALATGEERAAILSEIARFAAETPSRTPFPDRWEGDTGRNAGAQARPAVGCVFLPLLTGAR